MTKKEYEREREERIATNKRRLAALGLPEAATQLAGASSRKRPRQQKAQQMEQRATEPPRRSGRARKEVSYDEQALADAAAEAAAAAAPPAPRERSPLPDYDPPANCAAPVAPSFDPSDGAKRDAQGRLAFKGFPDFRPNLTPKQARAAAGAAGGRAGAAPGAPPSGRPEPAGLAGSPAP